MPRNVHELVQMIAYSTKEQPFSPSPIQEHITTSGTTIRTHIQKTFSQGHTLSANYK